MVSGGVSAEIGKPLAVAGAGSGRAGGKERDEADDEASSGAHPRQRNREINAMVVTRELSRP
ncbi:hypothetical protein GCM10009632_56090 [Mycolicibacterium alvei]|uniref:Uncharacterized protein n=1 Tax=Mycolicibacterium alvei TaxID=67081 RepID=A0A6N4V1B7_9MYCO|nr:hypothetical protein MALV_46170 [Mycolicibacterium alvei]